VVPAAHAEAARRGSRRARAAAIQSVSRSPPALGSRAALPLSFHVTRGARSHRRVVDAHARRAVLSRGAAEALTPRGRCTSRRLSRITGGQEIRRKLARG